MAKRTGAAGRPRKAAAQRLGQVAVRFPAGLLAEVDAVAGARLDKPDRSSIIRELVAEAITARKRKGKAP